MSGIAILGAGMAGLGAAHRLLGEGVRPEVFDKNTYAGGHATSFERKGFVFDEGPHISFTQDERLQALFAESVEGDFETLHTRIDNYWRGHWMKHPVQCNLHGLPTDLIVEIVEDFVAAPGLEPAQAAHYGEWLVSTYGRAFAETFPMQYGRKYHTVAPEQMTTDWLGPRLYRPKLAEVLRGALEPETPDVHYVSHFRYPTRGGFAAFLNRFIEAARPRLGHEVTSIDPVARRLSFASGEQVPYEHLVSSLPLPELVRRLESAPEAACEAASQLACTTCVLVNLGLDRDDITESHWTYFYDDDIVFTRLSAPHLLSPNNAPPGCGSLQAELYFSSKYRPLDRAPETFIDPVLQDLQRCGLLREDDRILHREASVIPYANIIFDLDRPSAVATIFAYLDELGIATCGRYGRWGYHWTDESFKSGEDVAQQILDRLG